MVQKIIIDRKYPFFIPVTRVERKLYFKVIQNKTGSTEAFELLGSPLLYQQKSGHRWIA